MLYTVTKIAVSAVLIVAISELARRSTVAGALLASLPVVSVLAFVWIYVETRDAQRIGAMSLEIFWLVLPSLALFLALPWLLRQGFGFWPSLASACALTAGLYLAALFVQRRLAVAG